MKKMRNFILLLCINFIASNAMEPVSSSTNGSAKRKIEESDGYDKELIESPTLRGKKVYSRTFTEKYYQCSLCPNFNCQLVNVKKHILRSHYAQPEVRIKKIESDGTVSTHIVEGLGNIHACNECGKKYYDKYGLTKHCREKNHAPPHTTHKKLKSHKITMIEVPPTDPLPLQSQLESLESLTPEQMQDLLNEWIHPKP